jgi:alkylation response protein AidB-like acyl-CoA dehydrogenase
VQAGHALSEADRDVQAAARAFVDELIPWEVEAEEHGGELPAHAVKQQRERVRELGFQAVNMPRELGGGGFTMLQQVLVSEQLGRATNALGWVVHTPAAWLPAVATPQQLERWVLPAIRGERRECYAITEEGAGSDVDAIRATAHAADGGYRLM